MSEVKFNKLEKYDRDFIGKSVDEIALKTFGEGFSFRKYQKETCVNVVYSILSEKPYYILEAPTGSGKSITAMIVAGVLSEKFHKNGYILISDLNLLTQYENDVHKYNVNFGVIRGRDNYLCTANGYPYSVGLCHIKGHEDNVNRETYPCMDTCSYLIAKDEAMKSSVTVCTYNHWFSYRTLINKGNKNVAFPDRDFVICDEAHKLIDIVQSIYSMKMSNSELNKLEELGTANDIIRSVAYKCCESMRRCIDSRDSILDLTMKAKDLKSDLEVLLHSVTKVMIVPKKYGIEGNAEKKYTSAYKWLNDYMETLDKYIEIMGNLPKDIIVTYDEHKDAITLNCINEEYLMNSLFYPHFQYCLCMSATIGNSEIYAENCYMKNYASEIVESTFDFSQSPIYYCDKYKMSRDCISENLPKVTDIIDKIMNLFSNNRGAILTSSYTIAKNIYENLSDDNRKRVILYGNSKDKQESLKRYKYETNCVIIGPSLFDGLSFDDDLCRFLVIAKVPYPDLNNEFVKKKMERSETWYSSSACNMIIQGVGRGVRNEKDWCYSFILDGCFSNLAGSYGRMFGETFRKRFKEMDENLNEKIIK